MPSPQPETQDVRRLVPRTDAVLADPAVQAAVARLGRDTVRAAVNGAQGRARAGEIAPDEVVEATLAALPARATTLTPVLNATGVVIHTNLGRAPLSAAAVEAMTAAAGTVDVELDLRHRAAVEARSRDPGRAPRGACPRRQAALVVNNGAAALVLATTALAAGREVVVSRGEMVEIGDGFRLPDLIASTGARLREVGTTNRTTLADYAAAVGPDTGCILKVHPSNFRVEGFTSSVPVADLARARRSRSCTTSAVACSRPHPLLPDEPDAASALARRRRHRDLQRRQAARWSPGGPGPRSTPTRCRRLRRHPLARALRADKTTLAALEATVRGPRPPVWDALEADPDRLRARCAALVATLPTGVGGDGGAGRRRRRRWRGPGQTLPGWAVALPEAYAELLRGLARARARAGRPRAVPGGPALRARALDRVLADAVREVLGRLA